MSKKWGMGVVHIAVGISVFTFNKSIVFFFKKGYDANIIVLHTRPLHQKSTVEVFPEWWSKLLFSLPSEPLVALYYDAQMKRKRELHSDVESQRVQLCLLWTPILNPHLDPHSQRNVANICLISWYIGILLCFIWGSFRTVGWGRWLRRARLVQWLALHTSTAGGMGSIPGQETNIPQATRCGYKKKKKRKSQVSWFQILALQVT